MKKLYLALLMFVFAASGTAFGQVSITSVPGCTSYTLTGTLTGLSPISSGITADDDWSNTIPIGFTFNFYGVNYTQCLIGSNGEIGFDLANALAYNTWPISNTLASTASLGGTDIENLIAGPWCDIYIPAGGTIMYSTVGTAPNRKFECTWCGTAMFSCTTQWVTTQIILYEGTNVAEVHIGHHTFCTSWNGGYAICGVVNSTGSSCTVAPGRDYPSNWNATNEAWRFTPSGGGYTVASIPYAPIPYAASAIYWYNTTTGAYLGSGTTIVVTPTVTTTYEAAAVGCNDTSKAFITLAPVSGGPAGTITGPSSVCLGSTISLTDATSGGSWSSSNPGVATVGPTGLVTSVSGGTTIISYSNGSCSTTHIVTVNTAPAITGTLSMCVGGTSTLADAVTGGTWISGTTSVATIGLSSGIVTGVSSGTSVITYTTPAGCTTTTVVTVVVLSPITGTPVVCQGATTTLFESGAGAGGTWSSTVPAVATIGAGTGVVNGVSGGTSNITYTSAAGCVVGITVTVNPTSPITGVPEMCQNFTTLLGDALAGGTWTSLNTSVAAVNSASGLVTGISGGTATIKYTLPTGCTMTTVVTVHPKPAPPVPNAPFHYCQFATAGAVSASGTSLMWYGPGVTAGMPVAPTPSTTVPGPITYYVTQTSSFGCVSDSAMDVITIIPQPAAPLTHDTVYCQFYPGFVLPLNYEVDSSAGSMLNWYDAGGLHLAGVPTPSVSLPDYPSGYTWHVSQTVNGCESPQAAITVTVVPTPKFDLVYQNWVCQHDSITLSFNMTGGSALVSPVFYWQLPAGSSVANGTSVTDPSVYVKFDTQYAALSIGYLTIGNLNGQCSTIDTFGVRVVPQPYAHSHCKPNICKDDTVVLALSDQSSNAENFFWKIDGTSLSSSSQVNIVAANSNSGGPYSLSWYNPGTHVITLQTSTQEGCMSRPTNDTIDVHDLPNSSFSYTPKHTGALCLEDSLLFTAFLQDANVAYLWEPEHCFNNNDKANIWGRVEKGRTEITLTVTDPFGCHSTTSSQLSPDACCTVLFPNAFTPNGDGYNDKFRPIFNGYHNFHTFKVLNRWGQTVFESANSTPEWDGSYNGVPQDMGVYYYFIKYDCGGNTIEEKGDCTLVR